MSSKNNAPISQIAIKSERATSQTIPTQKIFDKPLIINSFPLALTRYTLLIVLALESCHNPANLPQMHIFIPCILLANCTGSNEICIYISRAIAAPAREPWAQS